jgi:malonyl-CoA O-methyltransferase
MTASQPVSRVRVARNFAQKAASYEEHARVQRRVAERLIALLAAAPIGPGPVLEVGCGTGLLSRPLAALRPASLLVVSDLAHPMTRRAAGSLEQSLAVDADAAALPFAGGRFALLASSSVYQWVNCLPSALAEAGRVLAPGGLLALAMFGGRTLWELRESHRLATRDCAPHRSSHVLEFATANQLLQAIAAAGLTLLTFSSSDECEWHGDVPALLRGLKELGAGNAALDRPPGLARRHVMQRMQQLYRDHHQSAAGLPATYEVFYLLARRI